MLQTKEEPNLILIDLRTNFFEEEPPLPGSFNIPVPRITELPQEQRDVATQFLQDAVNMPEMLWKTKYNKCPQLTKDHYIVFYSSTGVRSEYAATKAQSLGFKAYSLFGGSRLWTKHFS